VSVDRCQYQDLPTGARCAARTSRGCFCEAHWEIDRVSYLARLEGLMVDLKEKVSDSTLSLASRRKYCGQLRDARRTCRMLSENE